MKKLSLLMCLLFISATACGKADVTESTTEATEATTEATTVTEATTETTTEATTEATAEATTEATSEATTEATTEAATTASTKFEMVRGGYYFVPDGFDNITKETYALRYVQEWQNYDLDMHMEITDAMQLDIPMTIDEEYEMYVNSYGEENLSLNKKEADGYILSGVDANGYVYYQKAKAFGDRYVCINITYPQANSDTCNKILEDFVFGFVYE